MLERVRQALVDKSKGKSQLVTLRAGEVRGVLKDAKGIIAAGLLAGVQTLPDSAMVHQSADAWLEIIEGLK
jgi:hypothetical protein